MIISYVTITVLNPSNTNATYILNPTGPWKHRSDKKAQRNKFWKMLTELSKNNNFRLSHTVYLCENNKRFIDVEFIFFM